MNFIVKSYFKNKNKMPKDYRIATSALEELQILLDEVQTNQNNPKAFVVNENSCIKIT